MCFTPVVSLSTALLEFAIAAFILLYYKKSTLTRLIPLFIILLGFYQFTEFMTCTFDPVWNKLGLITYTFLPALGMEIFFRYTSRKHNPAMIFIIPVLVAIVTLTQNISLGSTCGTFFVASQHPFLNPANIVITLAYSTYYFGFIAITSYLMIKDYKKTKDMTRKLIYIYTLAAIIISLLPAAILLVVFPALYIQFPSIYCEFALVFSLVTLVIYHLNHQ